MNEISGETTAGWSGKGVGVASIDIPEVPGDTCKAGAACTTPQASSKPARSTTITKLSLIG